MVIRDGYRARGHDYTRRFPWIVEAARKRRQRQFIIDGEAVLPALHSISDFDDLHSSKQDEAMQLYAFDIMALDGEDDLRALPLSMRETNQVSSWVRRRPVFDSRIPSATCRRRFARNASLGCPLKPFQ